MPGTVTTPVEEQAQITDEVLKGGFKADAGKARLDLVPPKILQELIANAIEESGHGEPSKNFLNAINIGVCEFWDTTDTEALWNAIDNANAMLAFDEDVTVADSILKLGELYEIGAKKYAARNWEKGMDWGRCFSALTRHLLKFIRGEKNDEVDGQHHLTSVVWNAIALLHFSENLERYGSFDSRKDVAVAENKGQA